MIGTKTMEAIDEPSKKSSLKIVIEKILKRYQLKIKVVEQVNETMKASRRGVTLFPPISAKEITEELFIN